MSTPTAMDMDVLAPFLAEWHERAKRLQEAVRALGAAHRAPRLEMSRDRKGLTRYTLVRRDGREARITGGKESRAVTTRFTHDEWAAIEQVVLLQHGLAPYQPITGSIETTLGGADMPPEF